MSQANIPSPHQEATSPAVSGVSAGLDSQRHLGMPAEPALPNVRKMDYVQRSALTDTTVAVTSTPGLVN